MNSMQAIILAAGEGSRMRPLTASRPKVMLPVGGAPLLEELILRCRDAGINRFVFVVGYRRDVVTSYFEDGSDFDVEISYAVQEKQLGTGHALMAASNLSEDRFFVINGDVLPDVEALRRMISMEDLSVATHRVVEASRYGVFLLRDGLVEGVVEKSPSPPSDMANAGIYLLDREIFEIMEEVPVSIRGEYELTDGINALAAAGRRIWAVELSEWVEVGVPWDILTASNAVLSRKVPVMDGDVESGATIKGNVSIGSGTLVRNGAYIEGPVWIGKNCDIGPNCYIRAGSCIGNSVRVGNAVEIKNSTIMDDTKIGHLSYVGDSVIGYGCNLGAGTIVSNLRHDNRNIRSYVKGVLVDTGRRKLGVIMGDGVKTGVHTCIYPGTVIEPGYLSRPGEALRGYVKSMLQSTSVG
ncbi:bifunctional sugar-1-phosphate nucleotidylyltransferase/acetyltransferase [Methanothrix sp.]|uniref:bifunctional sugar-1-phosphate nucleotidylyltransferase/acetyltransferase n=1 Tax=Methanothrix sp. TaxID=90426 RepID=UPI00257BF710|nr:bifunctional sugar-1-phosphate nucleotidylyltransferase/acetyltransferase [Methanothrix sp.]NPU87196.1 NTP transferase domain-containing protein [Methanothrix sp.]